MHPRGVPHLPGNAVIWMALQAGAVLAAHALSPGFEPIVRIDSRLYLQLARRASLLELLESIRTLGYPLWLRGVGWLSPDLGWLPHVQLGVYCLAVVGLCAALRKFGLPDGAAFAAATPPLYSPLVPFLAPSIMSDLPAASLALATVALLLVVLAEPRKRLAWAGLGLALFLTYQFRPSYLFLVALVPLAGLGSGRRRTAALTTLAFVPLLAFCAVRWWAVGHFGLVAFAGHNLSGLTTSMLTPELVAELPEDERELAQSILVERQRKGHPAVDASSGLETWRAPFISNSWRSAIQVARLAWMDGPGAGQGDSTRGRDLWVDRRLTRLSVAILRARPGLYLVWLGRAWAFTLGQTAANPWVWGTAAAAGGAATVAWVRRRRGGRSVSRRTALPVGQAWSFRFLAFALSYYLLAIGLLLLLQPPEWRYVAAAELLLPGALAAVAVELGRSYSVRLLHGLS